MAVANLLTLIDDIATILDDVAVYSKLAAKKTAPVLGDDLAVNAEQVSGVNADRELPVVWAVAKGSLLNKCILVPVALAISFVYPPLIQWLLMLGGAFLCFEGAEKIMHSIMKHQKQKPQKIVSEKQKIRGAIRTDFILSAEIIVIGLGSMIHLSFGSLVVSLSFFAIAITVFVYGLVAGIVKLDDAGLALVGSEKAMLKKAGYSILWFAPNFMKALSVLGMLAMFLVGGGILVHGIDALHHLQLTVGQWFSGAGSVVVSITENLFVLFFGLAVGLVLAGIYMLFEKPELDDLSSYKPKSNFSGQDLSGRNFGPLQKSSRSEFFSSDFTGANLSNSNFQEADLRGCDFTDADLSGADFTNAGMTFCVFNKTNVTGTIFKDTRLFDIKVTNTDFSNAMLDTKYQGQEGEAKLKQKSR